MFEIPEIRGRLRLDTGEFKQGMNDAGKSAESLGRKIAGYAAQYVTLRGLATLTNNVTKAFMQQETAIERYSAALRNQGAEVDSNTRSASAFATELQKITVYGDDVTQMAMASGLNLGIQADQIEAATKSAMVLAQKYGMDLPTAMMLMGRASQGQTQMLSRYGIVLDETMSSEEKFNELLKLGEDEFGLVTAAAQESSGRIAQYNNLIGDAGEEFGKLLLPAVLSVTSGLADMSQGFIDASPQTKRLTLAAIGLTAGIVTLNTGFVASALSATSAGMAYLFANGAAGTAKAGIHALTAAMVSHPLTAVLSVLGLVVAGLYAFGNAARDAVEAQAAASAEELDAAVKYRQAVEADNSAVDRKIARLEKLSGCEKLNAAQQKEASALLAELGNRYGEVNAGIDATTGKLNIERNAWKAVNEEKERNLKAALLEEARTRNINAQNKFSLAEDTYVHAVNSLSGAKYLASLNNPQNDPAEVQREKYTKLSSLIADDAAMQNFSGDAQRAMRAYVLAYEERQKSAADLSSKEAGKFKELEAIKREEAAKTTAEQEKALIEYYRKAEDYAYENMTDAEKRNFLDDKLANLSGKLEESAGGKPVEEYSAAELALQSQILDVMREQNRLKKETGEANKSSISSQMAELANMRRVVEMYKTRRGLLEDSLLIAQATALYTVRTASSQGTINAALADAETIRNRIAADDEIIRKAEDYEARIKGGLMAQLYTTQRDKAGAEGKSSHSLDSLSRMAGRDVGVEAISRKFDYALETLRRIAENTETPLDEIDAESGLTFS